MVHLEHAHQSGAARAGDDRGGAAATSFCGGKHGATSEGDFAVDPVCGMHVDRRTAKHRFEYREREILFCSARCRERFQVEPEKFLKPREAQAATPAGAVYTCPMHPEVRQIGPGSCPICGMAL